MPKIIHFNGANPWQRMVPMAALWWHHADAIADLLPPGFGTRRKARVRALRRNWRDCAGLLVLSPSAIRRARMAWAIQRRIVRPYLASLGGRDVKAG
ncbi:hypothetical protein [Frigidibacter sp.]|uniref:hypothetical protein n=1 Tax=Frigidibacter sp. TaxID=2586418 RepID=UPI00273752F7|nr:hypothetical protein [Frigidibacter sp.]MDP3339771.1 hypothetical protein [Frigidibacter sp.]